jgi:hypothetical protein
MRKPVGHPTAGTPSPHGRAPGQSSITRRPRARAILPGFPRSPTSESLQPADRDLEGRPSRRHSSISGSYLLVGRRGSTGLLICRRQHYAATFVSRAESHARRRRRRCGARPTLARTALSRLRATSLLIAPDELPALPTQVGHDVDENALDGGASPVGEGLVAARRLHQRGHALALLKLRPPAAAGAHPGAIWPCSPARAERWFERARARGALAEGAAQGSTRISHHGFRAYLCARGEENQRDVPSVIAHCAEAGQ